MNTLLDKLSAFWGRWRNTVIGKALEDFFWNVLYTSIVSGLVAIYPLFLSVGNQPDWGMALIVFKGAFVASFLKAASVFIDKYRHNKTPLLPE